MNESTPTITRYLLGELPESQQSALEEQYFADPAVFDEVTAAETALVDDYVRGRLSADMRRRFEQAYLADARRRNRVRFAEALAARLDVSGAQPRADGVRPPLAQESTADSGWRSWLGVWWAAPLRWGLAIATVLVVSTGIWLAVRSGQGREESSQVRATDAERPSPGSAGQSLPPSQPVPAGPATPSFATLILTVGAGERGQDGGRLPTLAIPPGTSDVRFRLNLREAEHVTYQIVLRAIGGPEILRRANLRPVADAGGPVLTVIVPASRFSAGDYMLTLQGAAGGNEFEDLSQSLFRVER